VRQVFHLTSGSYTRSGLIIAKNCIKCSNKPFGGEEKGGHLHRPHIVLISCKITLMNFHQRHQGSDLKLEIILRILNSLWPNLRRHILSDLKFSSFPLTICAVVKSSLLDETFARVREAEISQSHVEKPLLSAFCPSQKMFLYFLVPARPTRLDRPPPRAVPPFAKLNFN